MEFHQFHPTGLAGLGILISEAVRGEGGILRNVDGERFMERYAPPSRTSRPRHRRSLDGAGSSRRPRRPNKDYVYIDVTPRRRRPERKSCPTSPSSRAPTSGVDRSPSTSPCTRPATTSWAVSRPRSTARSCGTTTGGPRTLRRGRMRLCVGAAPIASAPTRCSTSTSSAVVPVSRPPVRRHRRVRPAARAPTAMVDGGSPECSPGTATSVSPTSAGNCSN